MTTKAEKAAYEAVASPFCAVCGATGKIDIHHIVPRSRGGKTVVENLVPLCHSCHMSHHQEGGQRLHFTFDDDGFLRWSRDGKSGVCQFADPNRDPDSPDEMDEEDGEFISEAEKSVIFYQGQANSPSYYASHVLKTVLERFTATYGEREGRRRLTEWAAELTDEQGNHRPIHKSTVTRMLAATELPEIQTVLELSVVERYRLSRALKTQRASFEDTLEDLLLLSVADFESKYLDKVSGQEKPRCECPVCHGLHTKKGAA